MKNFCLTFFLLLSLLFSSSLLAQILNVEKARINQANKGSSKSFLLNASFGFKANNRTAAVNDPIKFLSLNGSADLAYLSKKHSYLLINFLDYLSINEDPFISFGYTHLRMNFLRKRFLSYEVFGQAQYDLLRGLDQRFLTAAGFRFNWITQEKFSLSTGHGLMFEHEIWDNPLAEDNPETIPAQETANITKSANYISVRWALKDYLDFNTICYYQVGRFEEVIRNRINMDANLNVKLNNFLTFRVNFSCAYENQPIVPITKFIYSISNGIQFNFGKTQKKKQD